MRIDAVRSSFIPNPSSLIPMPKIFNPLGDATEAMDTFIRNFLPASGDGY